MTLIDSLDPILGRMDARMDPLTLGGYALVSNIGAVPDGVEFKLSQSLSIRPANGAERAELHAIINHSYPHKWRNRFESQVDGAHAENNLTQRFWGLPESDWKYVVLAHDGSNIPVYELVHASYMTSFPLELGFDGGNASGAVGYCRLGGLERALAPEMSTTELRDISNAELCDIRDVFTRLSRHDHQLVDLKRALRAFQELEELPGGSSFRFLGYIAILESILTHAPRPSDPTDSLTRQVKTKLSLVLKRPAGPTLRPPSHSGVTHDKLWGLLYGLRSSIAHGSHVDFDRGEFKTLGTIQSATSLVRIATSVVLRIALEEPQLIADLKHC